MDVGTALRAEAHAVFPSGRDARGLRAPCRTRIDPRSRRSAHPTERPLNCLHARCRALPASAGRRSRTAPTPWADRKSTRLNSSHLGISYAVFCLKKKKNKKKVYLKKKKKQKKKKKKKTKRTK